jgi:RNA polymerase sigma-70 factor (ECF subfamily)
MDSARRKAIHDAMVRLSDGDRSAFPHLLDELWPVILSFARRGVRHEQDAEDVAQEVFLRICSRISDFDRDRDGLSWALGIAGYEIMTHHRRSQRRRETLGATEILERPDPATSQEEAVIQKELAAAVTQMIGTISDEDRLTLGLVGVPGVMQVQGATLRKRRQRALDRLRAAWRRFYGEP